MPIIVNLDVMMAKRHMGAGELAETIGITPANLSILKNNKAKAVRFSTLEALCKALDCQPADLLEYRLGIHQFPSQLIRQQGMDAVLIQQSDHLTGNRKIGIFDSVWKKKNGQALFPFPGMVSKATPHNSRLTA